MATVQWRRERAGAVDVNTGRATTGISLTRSVDAAGIFPGQTQKRLRDGGLLMQDARKLLIAGLDMDPYEIDPGDVFTFEGADWPVYEVKRLAPDGGPAILFTVFVQRGA